MGFLSDRELAGLAPAEEAAFRSRLIPLSQVRLYVVDAPV